MREQLNGVCSAHQPCGIKRNVLFHPITTDAIPLHGTRGGQDASLTNRFSVHKHLNIRAHMRAAERQTQHTATMRSPGHFELNRPVGAANVSAGQTVSFRLGVVLLFVLTRNRDILALNSRRLNVIPVATRLALANYEIDVIRELLWIIEIQSPLPVMVAVAEFARRTVRHADL